MTLPTWYTNFWCPADMREVDPYGCGMGLGFGAFLLLVALIAVVAAVVILVAYFWPTGGRKEDPWRFKPRD